MPKREIKASNALSPGGIWRFQPNSLFGETERRRIVRPSRSRTSGMWRCHRRSRYVLRVYAYNYAALTAKCIIDTQRDAVARVTRDAQYGNWRTDERFGVHHPFTKRRRIRIRRRERGDATRKSYSMRAPVCTSARHDCRDFLSSRSVVKNNDDNYRFCVP